MKYRALFYILFCSSLLIGCQEEEVEVVQATPEFLMSGSDFKKWEIVDQAKFLPGMLPQQYRFTPTCPAGQNPNGSGVFYQVFLNGTIRYEDGCGTRAFIDGTWAFSDNYQSMTIQWPSGQQVWQIEKLSQAQLIVNPGSGNILLIPTP